MSSLTVTLILFSLLLLLLFLNVPLVVSIGLPTALIMLGSGMKVATLAQRTYASVDSFTLMAIPFFMLAGKLMEVGGMSKRIVRLADCLVGWMAGGLAHVIVVASAFFGALSGSAAATTAAIGSTLIPEMKKRGYPADFVAGIQAVAGALGVIIPPSITMIMYGVCSSTSIGKLFISGFGVGGLLCITMMILVGFISKKRGYGNLTTEKLTWPRFWKAFKPAVLPLLLPIIIIGGIRIGIFTATEAGAVAILYAALLGIIYREMHVKDMVQGLKETVCSTASIMLIVSAASVFSWILTKERIPQTLTAWMLANIHSKFVFLIVVNVFLLLVGMFIEGNASMIILVPLLAPIAAEYGINEIQFAMIYIFNNAIGALSPPMGTLMFVTCSITKCKTAAFIKEAVPFYILLVVNLMLLTWFEPFTTFLVNLFY